MKRTNRTLFELTKFVYTEGWGKLYVIKRRLVHGNFNFTLISAEGGKCWVTGDLSKIKNSTFYDINGNKLNV